jgi:hypothetical protein
MKALDTSEKTTGMAQKIASEGFEAVGVYLRPDRCSAAMIAELRKAGLKIWSMYEKGYPTSDGYFSKKQGDHDGGAAATFAKQKINQPAGTQIYACVDYDPDHNDANGPTIRGAISEYMAAFKAAVEHAGYVASVYGSGRTCRILMASGLAKSGWLCQSSSFAEHGAFAPNAAIVQSAAINNYWDGDEVQKPESAGLW